MVKKFTLISRVLTACMASILALATVGYGIADTWRSSVDDVLGTKSYIINTDEDAANFKKDYASVDDFMAAAKKHAVKQGEEGTVVMKNDNTALPLSSQNEVALFGLAAYAPYPLTSGDLKAGNDDAVDLVQALTAGGFTINAGLKGIYDKMINKRVEEGKHPWTGETILTTVYDLAPNATIGDMKDFKINEPPTTRFASLAPGVNADWETKIAGGTVGICVFSRPGGESNTYKPGSALDFDGNATGKDPLALSADELQVIDKAKELCSKVVVLLNTGNNMEISAIAGEGAHEIDAIAYIGCPNDYQFTGIVNALSGKVNATGALSDTFVYDNTSSPAMMNFGGDYFADYKIAGADASTGYSDPRYPGVEIGNTSTDSFGGGKITYNGGQYIVEAEGIYVGYKYYETRYYDSIANAEASKANSVKGSRDGSAWNYNNEVVYSFGHGLSYLEYEQNITNVVVDKTPDGNITATVEIKNKSDSNGEFLAQLYVQQPYTEYDKKHGVEKAAVNFLNSKKVHVEAGKSRTVEISVPSKYLASYDYQQAKTYILDEGTYYFTAAAGSHEAVNNFLTAKGYGVDSGMDAAGKGAVKTWSLAEFDKITYATDNGYKVTNVADNADLNYWLPDTVTYLSRRDWDGTYPVNYNDKDLKIASSAKKDEWLAEIRGQQYMLSDTGAVENLNGKDTGVKFSVEHIGYDQLTNLSDSYWDLLVSGISADQAVGAVAHGGSQSDVLDNVDNPIVKQSEGVNGFTGSMKNGDGTKDYKFNLGSQTLLGTCFNPELAEEWGRVMGESGLWLQKYDVWGTGLTQRRTPYNGRNYEYISEDPMLTNRIGYGILGGAKSKGIMCGPKHIGFNDQEHNRAGISAFMNEQKMRETDLRGFQGGLDDAKGLAVMVAFNRIGSTNASHHVGMLKNILREEWGFEGIISTDMMNNKYYFNPEACIMATVTQMADFGGNNSTISGKDGHDATWAYLSVDAVKNDKELVNAARQALKYQLYAFANSAVMNISTVRVTPWWEATIKSVIGVSAGLTGVAGLAWIGLSAVSVVKKEEA